MSSDSKPSHPETRGWLDRLTHLFQGEPRDKADILDFLKVAHENQLIDSVALSITEGALQVTDLKVRDVMIPRPQMVIVKVDQEAEEFLPMIIESGHSRFPVMGDSADEIHGILLAKDLLPQLLNPNKRIKLKDLLRPATVIPESKRLNALLTEFRTNRNHMAVVVDEYGNISGLITIEDVLEEIVGDIEDEYDIDEEDTFIRELDDGRILVNALTPVDEFNEFFKQEFSEDDFDTIGGIVMQHFGRLPHRNESILIAGLKFKVLTSDNRRIRVLQVSPQG